MENNEFVITNDSCQFVPFGGMSLSQHQPGMLQSYHLIKSPLRGLLRVYDQFHQQIVIPAHILDSSGDLCNPVVSSNIGTHSYIRSTTQ